uniref:Uncharacterized protein n=1 Tax=Rhizophora mucronata TaxID=61149 RepID=A0A2P2PC96_RHIMU
MVLLVLHIPRCFNNSYIRTAIFQSISLHNDCF